MSKTHCILADPHSSPEADNSRFDLAGKLIADLKPDVVINLGDHVDLASLSSYDKGKASFNGKNYEKDVVHGIEANDRLFAPMKKAKKKLPRTVILEGNHEHRIKKLLEYEPHLTGSRYGISFDNLAYSDYYNDVVEYEASTPGVINIDGIQYAHYIVSGVSGRPFSSAHHAFGLTKKEHTSTVVGHTHLFDYHINKDSAGNSRMGLVAGVFQDYDAPWAGKMNKLWHRGLCILRNVENGVGDLEWVSMERLKKEYGK